MAPTPPHTLISSPHPSINQCRCIEGFHLMVASDKGPHCIYVPLSTHIPIRCLGTSTLHNAIITRDNRVRLLFFWFCFECMFTRREATNLLTIIPISFNAYPSYQSVALVYALYKENDREGTGDVPFRPA